eukprot:COSAG04_NODE_1659_length_6025_cov_2.998313_2_plen_56_part_00
MQHESAIASRLQHNTLAQRFIFSHNNVPAQHIHGAGNVQRTTLITVAAPTLLSWQ